MQVNQPSELGSISWQPARQLGVPGKLLHAVNYFARVFVHCNIHLPRLLIEIKHARYRA